MRRNELHSELRRQYIQGLRSGCTKIDDSGYHNLWFVVPPPPPEKITEPIPLAVLAKANKVLNKLPALEEMDEVDRTIAYLFARQEALTSSRMEGTWSTIDHVLTPSGLSLGENDQFAAASIRSYASALEEAFDKIKNDRYKALNKELVCNMHQAITAKDPAFHYEPGQPRTPQKPGSIVLIGSPGRKEDSIYNPPPPEQVDRCFSEVMSWYQNDLLAEQGDAGFGMWLPVRIAVGHAHFEGVHPFPDGNGRVGRMLWPLQMMLAGHAPLYLSGYVEANKAEYGRSLAAAQKKLLYAPIIEFICHAIEASYNEAEKTRKILLSLPQLWRSRAKFRKGSAAERALDLLIASPIQSANELSGQLKIPFESASTALKTLQTRGIINERTGHERNRIFAAEEVVAILARPFGTDPESFIEYARKPFLGHKSDEQEME